MLLNCGVGEDSWDCMDWKEIRPVNPKGNQFEYSLEALMLKLMLQCFGHLMRRADSLGKTLMLGKIEGKRKEDNRGWDGWMASPTQRTWVWASSRSSWRTAKPGVLQSMALWRVGHNCVTEQQAIPFSMGSSQPKELIKPGSPALLADSLPSEPPGKSYTT